jgi:hypothetical protein
MTTTEQLLSDYLDKDQAATELGICGRTLDRWHVLGEGPPRVTMGRRILYRRSSLTAWLAARERPSLGADTSGRRS